MGIGVFKKALGGIGQIASIVPGGQGVAAVAAAGATLVPGDTEPLYLSPYTDPTFEKPFGWGAPPAALVELPPFKHAITGRELPKTIQQGLGTVPRFVARRPLHTLNANQRQLLSANVNFELHPQGALRGFEVRFLKTPSAVIDQLADLAAAKALEAKGLDYLWAHSAWTGVREAPPFIPDERRGRLDELGAAARWYADGTETILAQVNAPRRVSLANNPDHPGRRTLGPGAANEWNEARPIYNAARRAEIIRIRDLVEFKNEVNEAVQQLVDQVERGDIQSNDLAELVDAIRRGELPPGIVDKSGLAPINLDVPAEPLIEAELNEPVPPRARVKQQLEPRASVAPAASAPGQLFGFDLLTTGLLAALGVALIVRFTRG